MNVQSFISRRYQETERLCKMQRNPEIQKWASQNIAKWLNKHVIPQTRLADQVKQSRHPHLAGP